ncbi:MAG: DNA-protecting protein DprA, partial [Synergistes sp.]|nr:DNA-protecting protein DprA [Synergistes sp.]
AADAVKDSGAKISLTPEERRICEALTENEALTVDKLAVTVKISAADVLKNIAILSSKGIVYMSSPGRYSVKGTF